MLAFPSEIEKICHDSIEVLENSLQNNIGSLVDRQLKERVAFSRLLNGGENKRRKWKRNDDSRKSKTENMVLCTEPGRKRSMTVTSL